MFESDDAPKVGAINVVCLGGGTGMPSLLSGLKSNPWARITAIVNMFDTGGSSGELKDRFGILPPGDILKCMLALSEEEAYARKLLLKRIRHNRHAGHTGGNVLLMGLERVYGNLLDAIEALGQLLSVQGKVYPVTIEHSNLCAEFEDGSVAVGETSIDMGIHEGKEVKNIYLDKHVSACQKAVEAIWSADIICVGPGSFYTSVLPNLLAVGIEQAFNRTTAKIVFIPNLLKEGKGMHHMTLQDTVQIVEHYMKRKVDVILYNNRWPDEGTEIQQRYCIENKYPLTPREWQGGIDQRVVCGHFWNDPNLARHDSARLAYAIWAIAGVGRKPIVIHSS